MKGLIGMYPLTGDRPGHGEQDEEEQEPERELVVERDRGGADEVADALEAVLPPRDLRKREGSGFKVQESRGGGGLGLWFTVKGSGFRV